MANRLGPILLICTSLILSLGAYSVAAAQSPDNSPAQAATTVRSFFAFHFAHNKNFTVRNVQQRKRWLTPELYQLLLQELKLEAQESKAHPDEVPYFEGDPFTDSQDYPNSHRVGKVEINGESARVPVTLLWSTRTGRISDKRDIVVELTRGSSGWLIKDVVNKEGSRLSDQLKRQR